MKKLLFGMLFASTAFGPNIALAAWPPPPSIVGNWSVLANYTTGTLAITSVGGLNPCKDITGTIFGDPIQGYYCPDSGRIHFQRKPPNAVQHLQVYSASLSGFQTVAPLHMGGKFIDFNKGEFNFQAQKP